MITKVLNMVSMNNIPVIRSRVGSYSVILLIRYTEQDPTLFQFNGIRSYIPLDRDII